MPSSEESIRKGSSHLPCSTRQIKTNISDPSPNQVCKITQLSISMFVKKNHWKCHGELDCRVVWGFLRPTQWVCTLCPQPGTAWYEFDPGAPLPTSLPTSLASGLGVLILPTFLPLLLSSTPSWPTSSPWVLGILCVPSGRPASLASHRDSWLLLATAFSAHSRAGKALSPLMGSLRTLFQGKWEPWHLRAEPGHRVTVGGDKGAAMGVRRGLSG